MYHVRASTVHAGKRSKERRHRVMRIFMRKLPQLGYGEFVDLTLAGKHCQLTFVL
jgi:hypothetical protein